MAGLIDEKTIGRIRYPLAEALSHALGVRISSDTVHSALRKANRGMKSDEKRADTND